MPKSSINIYTLKQVRSQLLDEYDCGRMSQMNRQDEVIYCQGLMDGMIFGYWVAIVSRRIGKISV
ncbi:MAG: hypothetical protein K6U80_18690 [Firmicutes bacterium]|nr:hypothetical protein [Bacillota bacterium]